MHLLRTITLFLTSCHCLMAAESAALSSSATVMADIPAGEYTPLYTTDKTARKVAAFRLDVTSVTKRQFLEFISANPKWQRSKVSGLFADASYLKDWKSDTDPGPSLDSPVTSVSWFAARAYAVWLGKRLPSVDEWEYVGQADATKANAATDPKYTQIILDWYAARPAEVLPSPSSLPKNYYGVRAMHGLIWEWTEDFNNAMVTGESRGDSGLERNLFCAGGALSATDVSNYAAFMRFAFRSSLKGKYTTSNLGFRCAADVKNDRTDQQTNHPTKP